MKDITVIGAGVIGLTTALKIQEKGGYRVTILAETLPSDPKTIKYTSLWAGAHHVTTDRDDPIKLKYERDTFDVMWELSKPGGEAEHCFMRASQTEYYVTDPGKPSVLEYMPDFRYISRESLVGDSVSGVNFTTVTIDTPIYLNYLLSRFLASGGSIIRASVQHINEVLQGGPKAFIPGRTVTTPSVRESNPKPAIDALVVCVGLGARFLGGVEDKSMHPIRGQTVLIRAPWVNYGRTYYHKFSGSGNPSLTYIIPRRSGDVILGGTKVKNDWYPKARPETTTEILTLALALCPELAPPEARSNGRQPTIEDLRPLVVEEGCGFRPGRDGGIRVEVEWISAGLDKQSTIPVVYNYGHAGAGFQTSWGTAARALELLEKALRQQPEGFKASL